MPTISVIVPAYNAERTILETIASVQQQTFSEFELIVINDGSTDLTLELLQQLAEPRLKIFSYQNGGLSVARNRGIAHASGEFITFLDADDLWTPDKLELQLAVLKNQPEAGVAYSWTYFMFEESGTLHPSDSILFEGNIHANLLVHNFLDSGSNPLIRRQAIESVGEFEPLCAGYADWDYWLRLAVNWDFVVVPKHQIFYRISSGSMSTKVQAMENAGLCVVERAFQSAPEELQHLRNQSTARVYAYSAHLHLQHGANHRTSVNKASQKLLMAIHLYPKMLLQPHGQNLAIWLVKKLIKAYIFSLLNFVSRSRKDL